MGLHLLAYLAVAGIADILALYKTSCTPAKETIFSACKLHESGVLLSIRDWDRLQTVPNAVGLGCFLV